MKQFERPKRLDPQKAEIGEIGLRKRVYGKHPQKYGKRHQKEMDCCEGMGYIYIDATVLSSDMSKRENIAQIQEKGFQERRMQHSTIEGKKQG